MRSSKVTQDLMTSGEVALKLGRGAVTIWRWANEGVLPVALTVGSQRYFDRKFIEQLHSVVGDNPSADRIEGALAALRTVAA